MIAYLLERLFLAIFGRLPQRMRGPIWLLGYRLRWWNHRRTCQACRRATDPMQFCSTTQRFRAELRRYVDPRPPP
jgi:hypothetical protein